MDASSALSPVCKKSGSTDVFGRLWWDRPAFTIRTEFFAPALAHCVGESLDRLMIATAVQHGDPALEQLETLAQMGIGVQVSVLAGGTLIHGAVARPEDYAEHFDKTLDAGIEQAGARQVAEEGMAEHVRAVREGLHSLSLAERVKRRREDEHELYDDVEALIRLGQADPLEEQRDLFVG